jgi:hypothetical protein
MRRASVWVVPMWLAFSAGVAAAQSVKITSALIPDGTLRRAPAQLVVTTESAQPLTGATLKVTAPQGFAITSPGGAAAVDPSGSTVLSLPLGSFAGRISRTVNVHINEATAPGQYQLLFDVIAAAVAGVPTTTLVHESIAVTAAPEQPILQYFGWGLLGIVIGYALRVAIKVQATITPPALVQEAPASGQPTPTKPHWIRVLITKYYYGVDMGVTVVLGGAAMVLLLKNGHLPDGGATWYGALVLGLGLGLLTNSDLITRFKV